MPKILPDLEPYLAAIDEAFDKQAWHGPNLRGSIRGVTARQAAWRPAPDRHNIWELVLHAAYWKYTVRRRLSGEKRGSFQLPGSNFFARPHGEPRETDWKGDIAILAAEHARLRNVIAGLTELPPALLRNIRGIAFHDVYHAGQISLLKRMLPE